MTKEELAREYADILDCFKLGYFDERLGIIENTAEP